MREDSPRQDRTRLLAAAGRNIAAYMRVERRGAWALDDARVGLCAFCADTATKIVELQVSEKPERGEKRARGKRVAGTSKRLCERHARMYYELLKNGPRRREEK